MKLYFIILFILCVPFMTYSKDLREEYETIISDINSSKNRIWVYPFNPNAIFVDTEENRMHILYYCGDVIEYTTEPWDNKIMPANSAVSFNGNRYISINYNVYERLSYTEKKKLIAHESFHYYQDKIGYEMVTSNNMHLDNGVGRILFRCELNALYKALEGDTLSLNDALCIRTYRQNMYPLNNEVEFELNEGLAEYTSLVYTYNNVEEIKKALFNGIKNNSSIGYTNYFAYIVGPIYLYFLTQIAPKWSNSTVTDITGKLKSSMNIPMCISIKEINLITDKYRYREIVEQEKQIDNSSELNKYLEKKQCIYIDNRNINIFFNPGDRVIEVNDSVISLTNVQLKSDWGILNVCKGLMRKKDWSGFMLSPPLEIGKEGKITGDDYTLILNRNYKLVEENKSWKIVKSEN